jgi:septum formation protein
METPTLVLASGSPRRRELLSGLGLTFTVRPADLDESILPGEAPEQHVQRLAQEKAAARAESGEWVLAADTVVVIDGDILGKPRDVAEARGMLRKLAGRRHTVFSGVALVDGSSQRSTHGVARTTVDIVTITDEDITWYVATGEPMDKAGAYAIQGLGALFVEGIEGNYTNVVGLPIPLTRSLFRELGFDLRQLSRPSGA